MLRSLRRYKRGTTLPPTTIVTSSSPSSSYLLWDRKEELAGVAPVPMPSATLLAIPVGVLWLVAERLGIMEGRQIAAVTFLQVRFLAVLGRRFYWAACGPLLYLYFLVPFGEFLTPRLQDVTTWFIRHGLTMLQIPAYIDGYIIVIPQGTFFVAEACAGLRFLIASIAFGCLYALLMYRSPVRRIVFILASITIPIIANSFRGIGIVVLGYVLGSAQAAATDHVLYGWIFFSIVILILIAVGLPFREDLLTARPRTPLPAAAPVMLPLRSAFGAAAAVAIIAAVGPALTAGLASAAVPSGHIPQSVALGADCQVQPAPLPRATTDLKAQRVVCDGQAFDFTWQAFSPRATAGTVMAARRRLIRPVLAEDLSESWLPSNDGRASAWRVMHADDLAYALAVAVWVNGRPVRPGMGMRLRMAIDSLIGSDHTPIVMTVTPVLSWDTATRPQLLQATRDLEAFLQNHPDLDRTVGEASALRYPGAGSAIV
ncbi:MAG: exosortase A [Rhodopila sp.]